MGLLSNQMRAGAAGAAGGGGTGFYTHQIPNSVRIPAPSSTGSSNGRLTKTFGTVDSSVHWTLNFWIKRSALGGTNPVGGVRPLDIFTPRSGTSGSVLQEFQFGSSPSYGAGDAFVITNTNTGAYVLSTDNLFRDTSAWYNFHIQADLDNGTASERIKIFVNGTEVSYNVDNRGSFTSLAGIAAGAWTIGDYYGYGYPIQSYLAAWAYVDGYTHPPTDFAESVNGVWIPKDLSSGITWGSAGHLLMFQDSSALGDDTSGEGNDWTTANIATHDQMIDTPTFGSEGSANFATLNPVSQQAGSTENKATSLSEGNLFQALVAAGSGATATMGFNSTSGGKWYWEVGITNFKAGCIIGITNDLFNTDAELGYNSPSSPTGADQCGLYIDNGKISQAGTGDGSNFTSYGSQLSAGDVVGVALDVDNGKIWFSVNGTFINSGNPAGGSNAGRGASGTITTAFDFSRDWFPIVGNWSASTGTGITWNFGQDGTFGGTETAGGNADGNGYGNFFTAPPTGFLALCTGNLPVADAIDPAQTSDNYADKQFDVVSYTGNGGTNNITGYEFKPDLVMFKRRDGASNNIVFDSTRGATKYLQTIGAGIATQTTDTSSLTSFNADGFTLGSSSIVNTGSATYYSAGWKAAGGTTETLTAGSINTTAQVNADVGFSILQYTPNSTAGATLAHGLGAVPRFILVVRFEAGGASGWIYHAGMGATYRADWNNTGAFGTGITYWNNTTPTSSLITLGSGGGNGLYNGSKMIMYAWADKEGAQKFGSFQGNNNSNGTFVYTGHKPRMVWIRNTTGGDFAVYGCSNNDTTINPNNASLQLQNMSNSGVAEQSVALDILSNGFKLRAITYNTSAKYVYCSWGSEPFKYATAR